jgi:hypothetical protein
MSGRSIAIGGVLLAALVAGTISDVPAPRTVRVIGSYRVLETDFHVHSFPFSWGTLSPWDTVLEARHQGLDVVVMTPHNHVWVAQLGRWFSRRIDGPLVIVGEEIASGRYHLLAAGIANTISERQPAARAIGAVHGQGGVAIAAHPYATYWSAYDADALRTLDGAELVRPESLVLDDSAAQLHAFAARAPLTAIGASDHHGVFLMGAARTFVFARERSEAAVLDAVRSGRTIVYDRGRPYGDPALIALIEKESTLDRPAPPWPTPGLARTFSRLAAIIALAAALMVRQP